jgi:hypothetical protein
LWSSDGCFRLDIERKCPAGAAPFNTAKPLFVRPASGARARRIAARVGSHAKAWLDSPYLLGRYGSDGSSQADQSGFIGDCGV